MISGIKNLGGCARRGEGNHFGQLTGGPVFQSPEILTWVFTYCSKFYAGFWRMARNTWYTIKGFWHSVLWDYWHCEMK